MAETVFGPGCADIRVERFEAICSRPALTASTPMTFDVPVPSFAFPYPPTECVCFDFKTNPAKTTVVANKEPTSRVKIEPSEDCCSGVYTVTPIIEVPQCTIENYELSDTFLLDSMGSTATWRLTMQDCQPRLSFTTDIKPLVVPSSCFRVVGDKCSDAGDPSANCDDVSKLWFALTLKAGDEAYQKHNVYFNVKKTNDNNCSTYQISSGTMDLGALFGTGNPVFLKPNDGSGGGSIAGLHLDGSPSSGETWYGGGIGNIADDAYGGVIRRGALMRNGNEVAGLEKVSIPLVQWDNTHQIINTGNTPAPSWSSVNPDTENAGTIGNLNITMPTGLQWHSRGVALNMSTFQWNPSGLLSTFEESNVSALISPAPTVTTVENTQVNASGMNIVTDDTAIPDGVILKPGLKVDAGYGLRICGIDARTPEYAKKDWNYPDDRQGKLEVHYGMGLRIYNGEVNGKAQYLANPSHAPGALDVQYGKGLRIFAGLDPETGAPLHYEDVSDKPGAIDVNTGRGLTIGADPAGTENPIRKDKLELLTKSPDFMFCVPEAKHKGTADGEEMATLALDDQWDENAPVNMGVFNIEKSWVRHDSNRELVVSTLVYDSDGGPHPLYLRFARNGMLLAAAFKAVIATDRGYLDSNKTTPIPRTDTKKVLDYPNP